MLSSTARVLRAERASTSSSAQGERVLTRVRPDERAPRTCCVRIADWAVLGAYRARPELRDRPFMVRERSGPREVVRAASPLARADGVMVGMRRREAEARSAGLVVVDADPSAEAREFEQIARAVEAITPRLEVAEPGVLSFPTRGPARYFGGDARLAAEIHAVVGPLLRPDEQQVRVGIADGRYAARLAARAAGRERSRILVVAPGGSGEFLAPFPVAALGDERLAELLVRLGLLTLGDFANLPAADVLARFGSDGQLRHGMARGFDPTPADLSVPPPDLVESIELDPPAARVDTAAFAAKGLADRLLARLAERGLGCTRVRVEAETEHGERLVRVWRHEGALTPAALAERVRWQLDGWLAANAPITRVADGDTRALQDLSALADAGCLDTGSGQGFGRGGIDTTTGGLVLLRLVPEAVIADSGRQLGFWGGDAAAAERADRVLGRIQGMLGYAAVGTCVVQGGRTPAERIRFVPWGEPREPVRPLQVGGEVAAWPGQIPAPAPSRVFVAPIAAEFLDASGAPVRVNGRGDVLTAPAVVRCRELPDGGGPVRGWCGPWLHDVRWWDRAARQRCARFQVVVDTVGAGEVACLITIERGRAHLDAIY
jgi:protein ImuB